MKTLLAYFTFYLIPAISFAQSTVWINEIHYDNTGTDANEGVEIAGIAGTDLSCYTVYHINGTGGGVTSTTVLSGIIDDEGCGYGALWFPIVGLQNDNEGLALYNSCTSTLVMFISYEGAVTATAGPPELVGQTATNIGISEASTSALGNSLQLGGTGTQYTDFAWQPSSPNTMGTLNTGQSTCLTPPTIDATTLSSTSFNVDCTTGANGSLDFTSVGTFIAGNNFIVELSDISGVFSGNNIGSLGLTGTDVSGTINFTIPPNTDPGTTYCARITSTTPAVTSDTICGITINNTAPCTIVPSNPTNSFSITCSTGDNGTVDFASQGTFNVGNSLTVEISSSSGSFINSTVIGMQSGATVEGTGISGTINVTVPGGMLSGSAYCIRISSSDPLIVGDPICGISITNSESCIAPHITSAIINSCQTGPCAEGHNEIVFGSSGDYSFDVTPANFEVYYGTEVTVQTDNYTESLTTNATTTAVLNDSAGCPGLFVDATSTTIPADATFMLVRSTICPDALDWSSLCGQGPIYVIYTTDPTWQASGNFSNSSNGMRYFNTVITTTTADVFDIDYGFNTDDLTLHADGDFVTFNPDGGMATSYGNNGCTIDPIVLNADVTKFNGYIRNGQSHLIWNTLNETNNDYFFVDQSSSGLEWNIVGRAKGNGTTTDSKRFEIVDNSPSPGINYYRLHAVDLDGTERLKGIISLKYEFDFAHYNSSTSTIDLSYRTDIEILSTDGRVITRNFNVDAIPFDKKGIFLIRDLRNSLVQRIYID